MSGIREASGSISSTREIQNKICIYEEEVKLSINWQEKEQGRKGGERKRKDGEKENRGGVRGRGGKEKRKW